MFEIVDRETLCIHKIIDHITRRQAECVDGYLRNNIRYGITNRNIRGTVDKYDYTDSDDSWFYMLSYHVAMRNYSEADFYNKTIEARKMMDNLVNELVEYLEKSEES